MEVIIFLTWMGLFLLLPVALFVTATISYAAGMKKVRLIGKILLSVAGHILMTFLTFAFLMLLFVGAEPRRGLELSTGEELIGLFGLFLYGVVGWLLCSFINGKLIKSWTHFSLNFGKPPSIFSAK